MQVDEERATTMHPVPGTSAGKRAWCNICLKNSYGKEYDKNRKQISLAQQQCSKCAKCIAFNTVQLFAANAKSNVFLYCVVCIVAGICSNT